MLQDLRFAWRSHKRAPGFFSLALITLALGIASTTVLFSITESVLWRPFSFADSERLVWLTEFNPKLNPLPRPASAPNFRDWRARAHSFERLAAMTYGETHSLTGSGDRVRSNMVSSGFFETLAVRPALGRTFAPSEESSPDSQPAILADAFWRRTFGASPDVLGRQVKLDGEPYTIIGVLPSNFRLEFLPGVTPSDLYLPLHTADPSRKRTQRNLVVIGRLHPGTSVAQAGAELSALATQLAAQNPENADWTVTVDNLRHAATWSERRTLFLFLGFSCLVLVIACANVAGLQLVRFTGRQKEYALRLALGARGRTLLRQALAENACIAIPGGAAGALLASWGIAAIRVVLPPGRLVRSADIAIDARSLSFVLLLSLTVTVLFALAPLLLSRKLDLDQSLRAGSKGGTADPRTRRRIDLLIAAELALSFVLLFGAGLFVNSHSQLQQAPLGFDSHNVLTMRIVPGGKPSTPDQRRLFFGRLFQKAQSLGGIQRAAMAGGLPLDYPTSVWLQRPGKPLDSLARVITPDYFRVLDIPLLRGRAFTTADSETAPRVAIINENLAHALFEDADPIGRRLTLLPEGDPSIAQGSVEIVGLASNTRELDINEVPFDDVFLPFAQNPMSSMYLLLKTSGRADLMASAMRQELRQMDADGVLYSVATLDDRRQASFRGERFNMALVSVFAVLAVLLAAVGIYGAISFSTAQRSREFALRMALGALPRSILRLTLKHTARLTLAASLTGLTAALLLGQLLKSALYLAPHLHPGLIYKVSVTDPVILTIATIILLSTAAAASLLPASQASRISPADTLRHE